MKKFFSFSQTISGKTFLLRTLFTVVLSFPILIALISKWTSYFMSLGDFDISDPRQYAVSMKIESGSVLSGKTIMQSGLLKLNYSLLSEIKTAGKIITSIRSNFSRSTYSTSC